MNMNIIQHSANFHSKKPKITIIIALITICASVGFGILLYFSHFNPFNNKGYIETTGVIVDEYIEYDEYYDEYDDYNSTTMYRPIAEFEVDGEIYEVGSDSSSSIPSLLGKEVKILYNPNNPYDAFFKTSNTLFVFLIILITAIITSDIVLLIKGINDSIFQKKQNSL